MYIFTIMTTGAQYQISALNKTGDIRDRVHNIGEGCKGTVLNVHASGMFSEGGVISHPIPCTRFTVDF